VYQRILVPVDGSEPSRLGLEEAIKLAKFHGSQLRLLHVIDQYVLDHSFGSMYANLMDSLRESGKAMLAQCEAAARREGVAVDCVLLESVNGAAIDQIVRQAHDWPADLIVMGTHGRRGLWRMTLGSDAEGVLREAPVPVLLVRHSANAAASGTTGRGKTGRPASAGSPA